jgi:predicted dehydrogenase
MNETTTTATRRDFLKTSAVAAGALAAELAIAPGAYAAGSDVIRVGLIGCGGRGTGAAAQALAADPNAKLVAMGDAFADRIESSLKTLKNDDDIAAKVDVKPDLCFTGFDAYQGVIANSDVVLLCTPPHFRPLHLKAAVAAGKHVFAEKPVAVDAPGVRAVLATCEEARKKKLSIVSGLCMRYDAGFREAMKRIHGGALGTITTLQANDFRGPIWVKPRQPGWTDMYWQMRNWYYFTWLSGDFNVEQHIHYLDVCAWAMNGEYPVRALGTGGRQVRTGPEYGHIYDHFSVIYEYADGAKLFATCRQQPKCHGDISAHVVGTKGAAQLTGRVQAITGENAWKFTGPKKNMFQVEHDELFTSIREGRPINNGEYMAKSTLMAIMGRMAAYTGQLITWEMAFNSKEDLTPPKYDWDVKLEVPPVAMPGQTPFV